jgi:hypothetical protein
MGQSLMAEGMAILNLSENSVFIAMGVDMHTQLAEQHDKQLVDFVS